MCGVYQLLHKRKCKYFQGIASPVLMIMSLAKLSCKANICERHGRELKSHQIHRFSYVSGHSADNATRFIHTFNKTLLKSYIKMRTSINITRYNINFINCESGSIKFHSNCYQRKSLNYFTNFQTGCIKIM